MISASCIEVATITFAGILTKEVGEKYGKERQIIKQLELEEGIKNSIMMNFYIDNFSKYMQLIQRG